MRKAQNSKWAFKHVHLGIKHFKENNKIEAFQCLNQALNIDPQNVEGLVARGFYFPIFSLIDIDLHLNIVLFELAIF